MVRFPLVLSAAIAALISSVAGPARAADDFQSWADEIRRGCATTQDAAADRTACAERYLDRAITEGRLTQADVDACVPAIRPNRRARGGPALDAWSGPCGLERRVRATFPRGSAATAKPSAAVIRGELRDARIESLTLPAASAGTPLSTQGMRRADIVSALSEGRFALVPNRGLDNLRYFAQTIDEFGRRCPGSDRSIAMLDALPYLADNLQDTVARLGTRDVSSAEFVQLLAGAVHVFDQGPDCSSSHGDLAAYERCIAERDEPMPVLPSVDALNDVDVLLSRHGCQAPETRHYLSNLTAYLRQARLSATSPTGIPPADTPDGQRYRQIFDQCARQAGAGAADRWCGCFVQELRSTAGPDTLAAMSAAAFVDFSYDLRADHTIAPPKGAAEPGRDIEYGLTNRRGPCAADVAPIRMWREATLPRVTACLAPEHSTGNRCIYRTAWGSFSARAVGSCPVRIDSRVWGAQEVQCTTTAGSGAPEVLGTMDEDGTRRRRDCSATMCVTRLAVEREVPAGFLPKRPAIAATDLPLELSVTRQKAPRSLTGVIVGADVGTIAIVFDDARRSRVLANRIRLDIVRALDEDGGVVLQCLYAEETSRWYWFGAVPGRVRDRAFEAAIPDHPLLAIGAPRDWCPASPEALPDRPPPTRDIEPSSTPAAPAENSTSGGRAARQDALQQRRCERSAASLAKIRETVERTDRPAHRTLLARQTAKHEEMCGK